MEHLYAQFLREKTYLCNFSPRYIKLFRWVFNRWDALIGQPPDKQNVKEWVIRLTQSGISPVTVNTYARAYNSFLTWLFEEGHTPERLRIKKVKEGQRPPKTFTEDQLKKFLSFRPKSFEGHRLYAMMCLAIDTGVRVDELLTLKRDWIDLDNLLVKVLGKGNKERVVPISIECRKVLYKFLRLHTFDVAFPSRHGDKLNYRGVLRQLQGVAEGMGIKNAGWHKFRHTFASNYVKEGNIFYLQRILGHADIQTTKIYVTVQTADLQLAHKKTSLLSKLR
jgi:integrase/recombinase XerD